MRRTFSKFQSFVDFLARGAAINDATVEAIAGASGMELYIKAFKIFGDSSKLAELAEATQADRVAKGFSANEPLLRDGEMLRSKLGFKHEGFMSGVGSPEMVQLYHELGYINARTGNAVPPRPDLKIAMTEAAPNILALINRGIAVQLGLGSMLQSIDSLAQAKLP